MPPIQMTRMAKFALYGLRIYLVILIVLLAVRFAQMIKQP